MQNAVIPYISDRMLEIRARDIKPIVSFKGRKTYLSGYTLSEIKRTSFLWTIKDHIDCKVDEDAIKEYCTIYTLHAYGYIGPSISEILAQIPRTLAKEIVAFEIDFQDNANPKFVKFQKEALDAGYRAAKVILYAKS